MAERKGRRWTDDELSLLRRLAYRKEPLSTIAAALGRTVLAIRTKAAHERLPLRDDPSMPGSGRRSDSSASDGGR